MGGRAEAGRGALSKEARSRASISAQTRVSPIPRSTSTSKLSASSMRSVSPPTVSYKSGLATCSRARSGVRRTKCAVPMRTSPIKPEPGRGARRVVAEIEWRPERTLPARRLHRHHHGEASRERRRFTTSAALANNGSRKARERSDGRGSRAARSPPTPCGFSFMPSPIISATSSARWRRPSRSKIGR